MPRTFRLSTMRGPIKGVGMSSVEFKFLAMPNVDFEIRVSSIELEYAHILATKQVVSECWVSILHTSSEFVLKYQ